ncbi:MAG: hypothetical protein R6U96_01875 [Promethearchaeia archaeon]
MRVINNSRLSCPVIGARASSGNKIIPIRIFPSIATSISFEDGIMDSHPLDAEIKAAIKKISKRTFMLMDSTKFNKTSPIKTFDLDEIEFLITNNNDPQEFIEKFWDKGMKVDIIQVE